MKRKLQLLLTMLLLCAGVNSAWGEEVELSLTPSKDGYVRISTGNDGTGTTDQDKNFNGKNGNGMIIANEVPSTGNRFVGLMGFNLASVKEKVDAGYSVTKVTLRVTNIQNNSRTLSFFRYADDWDEATVKWSSSSHATYIGGSALATLGVQGGYGKNTFEAGQTTDVTGKNTNPLDITKYQSTLEVTSGDFFNYVVDAVSNSTVSFSMTSTAETQMFSKDMSESNWVNATTNSYVWNETEWTAESPAVTITRYAAILRYFGLTDADVVNVLCPRLTVTVERHLEASESMNPSKDIMLRYDNTTNYSKTGRIEFGGLSKTDYTARATDFTGLMTFNIDIVNAYKKLGYSVSSAKLVLTNADEQNRTVNVYKFASNWKEDNTTTYAAITEESILGAITDANKVATGTLANSYGKKPFLLGTSSTKISQYSVSALQADFTGDALATYIEDATTSEIGFFLAGESTSTTHAAIFTKDCDKTGFGSSDKIDGYSWNSTNSQWERTSETANDVNRYDQMLTYFGMEEDAFKAAVAPVLVVNMCNDSGESYTLQVSSYGATTLVLPYDVTIPENVHAYTLNYTAGNTSVKATEVETTIPANRPVLINAEEGNYVLEKASFAASTIPSDPQTYGALTGVYTTTDVPAGSYILWANESKPIGFYKANSSTVGANRAYLTADGAGARVSISFGDDDPTGIVATMSQQMRGEQEYYDLQGRRVAHPTKGLYIVNGKKVIIK